MPRAAEGRRGAKCCGSAYWLFVVPEDEPEAPDPLEDEPADGVSLDEEPDPALPLGEALDEPPEAEPEGLELEDDGVLLDDDGLLLDEEPPEAEPELDGLLGVVAEPEPPALPDMPEDELDPERLDALELLPCEASLPALSQPYRPPTASARGIRMNVDFLSIEKGSSEVGGKPPVLASAGPAGAIVHAMDTFTKTILYTADDGRARWREEAVPLTEGTPAARLSALLPAQACQLRRSPVGFRSDWHCTPRPQWVFILGGEMEIGLADGSSRTFGPGQHFYSADTLPAGATFRPGLHGHWSAQRGADPLVTLFLKDSG